MTTDPHGTDPYGTNPNDVDLLVRLRSLGHDEPPFATPVASMIPTAVSRGRRRRIAGIASRTVAVAVPLVVGGVAFAMLRPTGIPVADPVGSGAPSTPFASSARPTPAPVASGAVSISPPPSPQHSGGSASASSTQQETALPCATSDLTASSRFAAQAMNQPSTFVIVTNWTAKPCSLEGYPSLSVGVAGRGGVYNGPQFVYPALDITHSSTYVVPDPGVRTVRLEPRRSAWFAVGTGLAYSGPVLSIGRLEIGTAGSRATLVVPGFVQQIQGNAGQPLPITVTAFAPGSPPARG